jgi:hypothetical protein
LRKTPRRGRIEPLVRGAQCSTKNYRFPFKIMFIKNIIKLMDLFDKGLSKKQEF